MYIYSTPAKKNVKRAIIAAIESKKIVLSAGMKFGNVGSTNSLFVVEV